jgi:hypothetical protein
MGEYDRIRREWMGEYAGKRPKSRAAGVGQDAPAIATAALIN